MKKTSVLVALAAAGLLGACNPSAPPQDAYDVSRMDLKPVAAKVSAERHKGAFAEGAALSAGPELKPLDPSPVKTIRLDTRSTPASTKSSRRAGSRSWPCASWNGRRT